jgi:hypothetical protein
MDVANNTEYWTCLQNILLETNLEALNNNLFEHNFLRPIRDSAARALQFDEDDEAEEDDEESAASDSSSNEPAKKPKKSSQPQTRRGRKRTSRS